MPEKFVKELKQTVKECFFYARARRLSERGLYDDFKEHYLQGEIFR